MIRRLGGYYDDHDDDHEPYMLDIRGITEIAMFSEDMNEEPPTAADINAFFDASEAFYFDNFDNFRRTRGEVTKFRMGLYDMQYVPGTLQNDMMAKVLLSWRGQAFLRGDSNVNANQIARAMENADYVEYIIEYLWQVNDGETRWFNVQAVEYDGTPFVRFD